MVYMGNEAVRREVTCAEEESGRDITDLIEETTREPKAPKFFFSFCVRRLRGRYEGINFASRFSGIQLIA